MHKNFKPSEIASICGVHHRTVSRWISQGHLNGYKLPGRGNYRVSFEEFVKFLNRQNMPIPHELEAVRTSPKVLVIDDEQAIIRSLSRLFNRAGYEVQSAKDGFEAGIELIRHKPLLVTLDLSMPGMNGFEVLEFIRDNPDLHQTRVMVISGLSDNELSQAVKAGADRAIRKPYSNNDVLAFAQQVLEGKS